jgi:hypothetical protein
MNKSLEQAKIFLSECKKHGFSVEVFNNVIKIKKRFSPGDKKAYTYCDMFGESVLSLAPLKGGSVWGTDGASVGGYVALTRGEYILNKSGSGSKFISALKKLL